MRNVAVLGAMLALLLGGQAQADLVTHTYYWTGADLLNNQFVDGPEASAAENGLFDGARMLGVGDEIVHPDTARTYVGDEHDTFNDRWETYTDAGYVLDEYYLWGFNEFANNWGEDYKPYEWVSVSAPEGWTTEMLTLDDPPADEHTDQLPWFGAGPDGLALDASEEDLAAQRFSATIQFNRDDAWWDQETYGAPNALDSHLTMWFDGYVSNYDTFDYHTYEGNFTAVVPEPATVSLLGIGLAGLAYRRMRKPAR